MQDPARETAGVVKGLIESPDADAQAAVLQQYFLPDAGFDHPLCAVAQTSGSRDMVLLRIYQWLRVLFYSGPDRIRISSVAYDAAAARVFVDARQNLVARFPPLRWAVGKPWARIVVVLHLKQKDGLHYIQRQEDLYQVQVIPGRIFPGLPEVIVLIKLFIGFFCIFLAEFGQRILGVWTTTNKPKALQV